MSRAPITAHELLQGVILGALSSGVVYALVFLASGEAPPIWAAIVGGTIAAFLLDILVILRHARERQRLQDDFERPAFGEDA
ncbi:MULTISPECIES: hypothetical protein [Streptomyces]|uniref:hypothetical protein n=1 Tax=Streptomyces TaxID=1883 RepID=UPI00345B8FB0